MPITQVATNVDFPINSTAATGTVSSTITVPAGTELVLAGVSGASGAVGLNALTFTKGGVDTSMTRLAPGSDGPTRWQGALFSLVFPDVGPNMTLKWNWGATIGEGNLVFSLTFWKGMNTSAPVRDSKGAQGPFSSPVLTAALTSQSGDQLVAFCGFFYAPGDGAGVISSWANLTQLVDTVNKSFSEGAWATGNSSVPVSVGVNSSTGSEGGIAAVALALPPTGGGGWRGLGIGLSVGLATGTAGAAGPPPLVPTIWNASDLLAMTLSNGNKTATSTGTAGIRAANGYGTSKYYFEALVSPWGSGPQGPGLGTSGAALNGGVIGVGKIGVASSNGTIWSNNGSTPYTLGARASGDVIGIAADLAAGLAWFRVCPSGSWNAVSGTANNPATGAGGANIAPLGTPLFPGYWTTSIGDVVTINAGGGTFVGTVPAGFTAGWPA